MNDSAKKGFLIVVILVALIAVGFSVIRMFSGDQMQVEKTVAMPQGFKSEKERAIEAQSGKEATAQSSDRDLGGAIGH